MAPRMLQGQTDANEAAYPPDGDVCIFMSPDKRTLCMRWVLRSDETHLEKALNPKPWTLNLKP